MAGDLNSSRKRALEIGTDKGGFPADAPYDHQGGYPKSAPAQGGSYKDQAPVEPGDQGKDPSPFKVG